MKKLTKGENTARMIYDSAVELFRKKGYSNVSVDAIVKKAGIAKGTFYVHYNSKGDIITKLFSRYDEFYKEIENTTDKSLPISKQLEDFVSASCTFTVDTIGLDMIRVLYQNQLTIGQIEQDALRADRTLYRIIHDMLTEGQKNGTYRTDISVENMESWVIRCIRGTFYEWAMKEGSFDLSEETVRYVRAFCKGIEATS